MLDCLLVPKEDYLLCKYLEEYYKPKTVEVKPMPEKKEEKKFCIPFAGGHICFQEIMYREFEITDVYSIGESTYQDKIKVEIDEDGLIIHPLDVFLMKENSEPVKLGTEEGTITILKSAAIALAEQIREFYGLA